MRVSDVITSKAHGKIYSVAPRATVQELLDKLAEHNVGALVVSDDGETLLGIVSERDIVRKLRDADGARSKPVSDIMTPAADVRSCAPSDSFGALMAVMTDFRVRHVPVIEDGKIVAILSIGDAVKFRMDQLEFERDQLSQYVTGG